MTKIHRRIATHIATALWFLVFVVGAANAESLKLPVTKDNSIVLVDREWDQNAGQQGRIRIKGNQHIVAMGFDTSAIAGRMVTRATLVCEQGEQILTGVTISTIATPWDNDRSNGLTCGVDGIIDWGYSGARFPAVCGGNSETMTHQVSSILRDGRYEWPVPPDMIHAMSIGVAHGLAIHEHDADYSRNPTIFSSNQSGKKPYLIVEVDDVVDASPEPPARLELTATGIRTSQLRFTPPSNGFAYEIAIDNVPLGRHSIPLAATTAGEQVVILRDLPASIQNSQEHEVQVITLNRTGQRSKPASVRGKLFRDLSIPAAKISSFEPQTPMDGVGVIPVTDKYDINGKSVGELADRYRSFNTIFDGRTIHLTAAAGEVTGFQLLLRGSKNVSLEASFNSAIRSDLWQAVYVAAEDRRIPDPLLPLPAEIVLLPDQDTVIVADLYIPFEAAPGVLKGMVAISDGRKLPIEITVFPFALPKEATFFCEMNGYGLPDHVNDYYQLQQIAYDHRVHSNILHYSHNTAAPGSRKSNMDMRLKSGRRMDNARYDSISPGAKAAYWDDFAEAFGPVLDGSLFENGHRGRVPVPGFYLTFHESWPLHCRAYFNGNPDAYQAFQKTPEYADTFVNILQDFVRVAEERQWTETGFQVYLNNKGSMNETSRAPWILDEPSGFWDYRALQFYGELADRGRASANAVRIDYRVDISRPEFCRGQLSHRADLWIVSSWAFQHYNRLVCDRMRRDGLKAWVYGTSNPVHESNRDLLAWALDVRRFGATGLVPWQTVNKDGSALKQADQLGLFIFDKDTAGQTIIRHSLRLKAYREAQQLIEYLNILQTRQNWSDEELQVFIRQYVPLDPEVRKSSEEDAGTSAYRNVTPQNFDDLRQAAAQLISASSVRPTQR